MCGSWRVYCTQCRDWKLCCQRLAFQWWRKWRKAWRLTEWRTAVPSSKNKSIIGLVQTMFGTSGLVGCQSYKRNQLNKLKVAYFSLKIGLVVEVYFTESSGRWEAAHIKLYGLPAVIFVVSTSPIIDLFLPWRTGRRSTKEFGWCSLAAGVWPAERHETASGSRHWWNFAAK